MVNERDNAFTTAGIGGMDQGSDFDTGPSGTNRTDTPDSGRGEPVTARAKDAVSTASHKAAERVQERIADQVTRATDQLGSVASSLRTAGAQMPDNDIGRYMVQAANQVDNLTTFLNNREVGELVDEVEDFARRQPAAFIGGAFALGVLGARFLRSSRRNMETEGNRGRRRSYLEGGYDGVGGEPVASFGRPGESGQQGYGTSHSADSTPAGSDYAAGGYRADEARSGGYTSNTPETLRSGSGMGASSRPGSTPTNSDPASDIPSRTRDGRTPTEGMIGSGTSSTGSPVAGTSASGSDRGTGSLMNDDDTRTTGFRNDTLSTRPASERDPESLDREADNRSPDFL